MTDGGGMASWPLPRTTPRATGVVRSVLALAVPALGALVAEPLFLLTDAAVVGRTGPDALAGLATGSALLATAVGTFVVLAYATTADVGRRAGGGDLRGALERGVDGLWLALGVSVVVAAAAAACPPRRWSTCWTRTAGRPRRGRAVPAGVAARAAGDAPAAGRHRGAEGSVRRAHPAAGRGRRRGPQRRARRRSGAGGGAGAAGGRGGHRDRPGRGRAGGRRRGGAPCPRRGRLAGPAPRGRLALGAHQRPAAGADGGAAGGPAGDHRRRRRPGGWPPWPATTW